MLALGDTHLVFHTMPDCRTPNPQEAGSDSLLLPNIFIPQICPSVDELGHQLNALRVVEYDDSDAALVKQIFRPEKISMLSDDYSWNAVKQRCPGAHDAGAERADQRQLWPIAAAASVANASGFCVRRGISGLHTQIVTAGDDAPLSVRQYRSDGQSAFAQTSSSLGNCLLQQFAMVHCLQCILRVGSRFGTARSSSAHAMCIRVMSC